MTVYKFIKRTCDILLSFLAILILSPLFLICILILWLTGEHCIWYPQVRIGRQGLPFKILKFVTMLKNSPNMGAGDITLRKDPRVLPFGRILRMAKINELPQLFNILIGDMSIVGPRPITAKNFNLYTSEVQKAIGSLTPGLTGIGSIIFRDEERYLSRAADPIRFYAEKISPYKGQLELWYQANASIGVDVKVIFLTAWVILFPTSNLPYKWLKNLPEQPAWMRS